MQNMIKENKRGEAFMTSTKIDQFCDPNPLNLQKLTTDILFKNNRICKHRSFKTPPTPVPFG